MHFGERWPTIPDESIAELRIHLGDEAILGVPEELAAGTPVRIVGGAFHGLLAVVSQVLPARQRVAVLLEFLGRQSCLELPVEAVVRDADPRARLSKHKQGRHRRQP